MRLKRIPSSLFYIARIASPFRSAARRLRLTVTNYPMKVPFVYISTGRCYIQPAPYSHLGIGRTICAQKLYHFSEKTEASWSLEVNEPFEAVVDKGFIEINRVWADGDHIDLDLPMNQRHNVCDDQVPANRGRVALTRGPLVLCAEEPDNDGAVQRFYAGATSEDKIEVNWVEEGILSGSPLVTIPLSEISEGCVQNTKAHFIPYSL